MKITFNLKNEQEIEIINDGKIIGRIFTPSGTSRNRESAIQVCGFDEAFEFWACGVFGDGNGNPKKDIQLLFKENSKEDSHFSNWDMVNDCGRCFYPKDKCKCKEMFKIKSIKELVIGEL